ncbi:beta-glucuronosyltransferase GlcAT14A-like [Lolium rigidum]|uniref:beta-glucuronosyltransferase GlcAT14A-like n=1 Tax=Lolium rigidum TaxID=89674 RepID=UPI001F5DB85B|nr:beta-glucuronosyltransferase GlcAT14A-like [Lolium rigidum]
MESNDRDEHQSPSIKLRRGGSDVTTSLVNGRWVISAAVTVFLFIAATLLAVSSSLSMNPISASFYTFVSATRASFAAPPTPPPGADMPRLAYLISGSKGDLDRLWRVLHALYHPRNLYVVHLDLESSVEDRLELAVRVDNSTVFQRVGNVEVIRRSNMVTYRGPTMVANTLHACAMLLHRSRDWDWFINLSASDYPLMTQDDILHVFSTLPRNVSFMEHTSRLGWKANVRGRPLIVDPGLYMSTKQDIFTVTQRRELPTAFKLYTGSAWMALTRDFLEYVVWGWESNLPRTLLMYYTNFVSSPEFYFQTLLCNTPRFVPTVANHDLHYIQWGKPAGQHPLNLRLADKGRMVSSNAPFARKIGRDDPLLDAIDAELLLGRGKNATAGMFVPGGWCGQSGNCSAAAAGVDDWVLRPGPGAERLGRLMDRIVRSEAFVNDQCK